MFRVHHPAPRRAADFLSLVDPKVLRGNGIDVVFVYLKNITRDQIKAYHDAGLSVVLIHEARATDGLDGAVRGLAHGALAASQAKALGAPTDVPIVFASAGDYDVNAGNLAKSVAYWRAAKTAAAAAGYAAGCYGDWDLLAAVGDESALNVQAAAKGWSWDWVARKWRGVHRTAHLLQAPSSVLNPKPSVQWPGSRVDFNDIVRPIRAWYPVPKPKPKPPVPVVVVPGSNLRLTWPRTRNSDVKALNNLLRFFGWAKTTGDVFDAGTKAGVVRMQKALNKWGVMPRLVEDGIYGPKTRATLHGFLTALGKL